jgi:ribosome recycling factor
MFDFSSFRQAVAKTLAHIETDIASLRTGGANPRLLDSVKVEAYGTVMKVTELAAITVANPTLLLVSPWDESVVGAIEKGIQQAGINLNPVVDGKTIRIHIPPLTTEARQQLVKTLHQQIESGKVMIRNLRTETKKAIEAQEGQDGISEDHISADLTTLDNEVKTITNQIDALSARKADELLQV